MQSYYYFYQPASCFNPPPQGLIGNIFVVYASSKYSTFTLDATTIIFVKHLAHSDILKILVMNLPMFVTHIAKVWIFGDVVCEVTAFVMVFSSTADLLCILAISIHRFIRCCVYPQLLKTISMGMSKVVAASIWVLALIPAMWYFCRSHTIGYDPSAVMCIHSQEDTSASYITMTLMITTLLFTVIVLNVGTLLYSRYRLHTTSSTLTGNITILGISMGLFLSYAWLPYALDNVIVHKGKQQEYTPTVLKLITHVTVLGAVANPLVYTCINKRFQAFSKRELFKIFLRTRHSTMQHSRSRVQIVRVNPVNAFVDVQNPGFHGSGGGGQIQDLATFNRNFEAGLIPFRANTNTQKISAV